MPQTWLIPQGASMRNFRLLLVDDDQDILKILKDNLELDGYRVITSSSGKEALSLFEKEEIDLIVLDLMLPDMDGIQVCRAVRTRSHIPIIMLTAKDGLTDKVLGLESGADDYLIKPFDYLELEARIKACLRRTRPFFPTKEVLKQAHIQLDPNTRTVVVNTRQITLTRKEFDILMLLMENAGRVLEREWIKKELWPEEKLYRWSRTIDVHIQHLRAKLEENPDQPRYIVTVPGVGYMFSLPDPNGH